MNQDWKLNVFISWSGQPSGEIAKAIAAWLKVGFQFTNPFVSQDIGAGKRWNQDLSGALENTNFGIVILTPETMHSDWILFESGALAKHLETSRLVPVLVDMEQKHLKLPLADFQSIRLSNEMFKLAEALNDTQPNPWDKEHLRRVFDVSHSQFIQDVEQVLSLYPLGQSHIPARSTDDMLEEVLQIVKSLPSGEANSDITNVESGQFYPVGDRVKLYKFLKDNRIDLPLYQNASMPALFGAATDFMRRLDNGLSEQEALTKVAIYLVSERPLMDLLDGLKAQKVLATAEF